MPLRQQSAFTQTTRFVSAESERAPLGKKRLRIWHSGSDADMQTSFPVPAEEPLMLTTPTKARHHPCRPFLSVLVQLCERQQGKTLPGKGEALFPSEAAGQTLNFQRKPLKKDPSPPGDIPLTGPGERHGLQLQDSRRKQSGEVLQSAETMSFAITNHAA